ncbi:MAG: flagellar assembly protein FliW [Candidatus Brocadiae bacterium]|nr:flagellar assembly protein FliW [Candidatus Brocadiia bacterium]
MPTFTTTRFGPLTIPDDRVYTMAHGLPGFPGLRQFVLLPNPGGGPFQWLQSVERGDLAFVVCDPCLIDPAYTAEVRKEDLDEIGLANLSEGFVVAILTVPADPKKMTANLLGPIVFSPGTLRARQVVQARPLDLARVAVFGAA